MNQYLEEDNTRIKQDFYIIKLVVFIILTYDLLGIVIGFITKDFDSRYAGSLFWDIFFSYHMLKMKEWARKWTIARTIIGMIFGLIGYALYFVALNKSEKLRERKR